MSKNKIKNSLVSLISIASQDPNIEALLGLGSIANPDRLDDYSDIDFFLIVKQGHKQSFIETLSWLMPLEPVFYYQNTQDGYKVLLANHVMLEFAVFTMSELINIPYHRPVILFARTKAIEKAIPIPVISNTGFHGQYHLEEALTNLYIGLLREHRGEKFAAFQMIQEFALHQVLLALRNPSTSIEIDPFNPRRRIEQYDPELAIWIHSVVQGIQQNRQAASMILNKIKAKISTNPLVIAIEKLL
jgi:uncharacterized membrane protein YfbV (UPF0208 family)